MDYLLKCVFRLSLLTVIVLTVSKLNTYAQNAPITVIASAGNAQPGQPIVVPVTVSGFTGIGSFSLSIDYDYTKLHFVSGNKNPLLSGVFNIGDNDLGSGVHRVLIGWYGGGASLPEGSWLINLTFTYISGSPALEWYETGQSCEYSTQSGAILNDAPTATYYTNGRVCGSISNPGQVLGSNTICQGAAGLVYSISPLANVTGYIWTVPPGVIITAGINTNSISVDFLPNAVSGNISVYGINECGNGPASIFPVLVNSLPVANAGNDTTITYGTALQLHAATGGTGSYTYHWTPVNLLINPNLQNPISVPLTNTTLFFLEVKNTSTQCLATDELVASVSGGMVTANPIVLPGAICRGQFAQLFANAGGGTGVYSYFWTSNPPGTPTWSSTLPNPIVNPDVSTQYMLLVNDGITPVNGSAFLTVNQLPTAQVSGGGTLCSDGSLANIRIDLSGIQPWSFVLSNGINSTTIAGINTTPYLFATNIQGIYSVQSVQDQNCFGTSSGTAQVMVYPLPPTPAISYSGVSLISSSMAGNQWYHNGQPISGATAQSYIPVYNGLYYCIVTQNGCSSDTSNVLDILIAGNTSMAEEIISIFPNPAHDYITLKANNFCNEELTIEIISLNGIQQKKWHRRASLSENEFTYFIGDLRPGAYFVKIETKNTLFLKKIIIFGVE